MAAHDIATAKLLVAVGPSPNSEFLVRRTRDLAKALSADWIALHVETGKARRPEDADMIEARLDQARALGGETVVVSDTDIAERIIAEARDRGCSMIVIGRSGLSAMRFSSRVSTISDKISRLAGSIDVVVAQDGRARRGDVTWTRLKAMLEAPSRQYALLAGAFTALLALGYALSGIIGYRSVALVYLAAVICLSLVARPAIVAALAFASASALNYFLIPPYFTFRISLVEDSILFAVYFFAAFVTSTLVATVRSNGRLLRDKERRSSFLFDSLQRLTACRSIELAAETAAQIAASYCARGVLVYVAGPAGKLEPLPYGTAGDTAKAGRADFEAALAAAEGAPDSQGAANRYSFVPASSGGVSLGAIGVERGPGWARADAELMRALGRALALVVDRENREATNRKALLAVESERLSRVLLDTVSHELRTPLTAVTGAVSALCEDSLAENAASRKGLLAGALRSADRLNAVVEDLLSASRIGSGMLRLKTEVVDHAEIANAAVAAAAPYTGGRRVAVSVDEAAGSILVDLPLVARMTANLLRNACLYSRPGGTVDLSIARNGDLLRIEVGDEGPGMVLEPGVPPFRKFTRGHRALGAGLGLGLVICEGIVTAHGGRLEIVENGQGRFVIAAVLPVGQPGGSTS